MGHSPSCSWHPPRCSSWGARAASDGSRKQSPRPPQACCQTHRTSGTEPRQKQAHRQAGVSVAVPEACFLLSRVAGAGPAASPPPRAATGARNSLLFPLHFFYVFMPAFLSLTPGDSLRISPVLGTPLTESIQEGTGMAPKQKHQQKVLPLVIIKYTLFSSTCIS